MYSNAINTENRYLGRDAKRGKAEVSNRKSNILGKGNSGMREYYRLDGKRSLNKTTDKTTKKFIFKFLTSVVVIAMIVVFVLALGKNNSIQAGESIEYNKYFKSVEVNSGDTLWSIAKECIPENSSIDIRNYVKEVQQINSLNDDNITSGMNLVVPYYAE